MKDHDWKEVLHDNTLDWIACWPDNSMQNNTNEIIYYKIHSDWPSTYTEPPIELRQKWSVLYFNSAKIREDGQQISCEDISRQHLELMKRNHFATKAFTGFGDDVKIVIKFLHCSACQTFDNRFKTKKKNWFVNSHLNPENALGRIHLDAMGK